MGKKIFLAVAGAILLAGIALAIVGAVLGGASDILQRGSEGFIHFGSRSLRLTGLWPHTGNSAENSAQIPSATDAGGSSSGSGQVAQGDDFALSLSSINDMDIAIACGKLTVKQGNSFGIEVYGDVPLEYSFNNGDWYIGQPSFNLPWLDSGINYTITLPPSIGALNISCDAGSASISGLSAESFTSTVAAGSIRLKDTSAANMVLQAEAGNIEASGMACGSLSAQCSAGKIEYEGSIDTGVNATTAAGSIEIKLPRPAEYSYNIEVGMGTVILGNDKYSGLSSTQSGGSSGAHFELDCSMGSITVRFD